MGGGISSNEPGYEEYKAFSDNMESYAYESPYWEDWYAEYKGFVYDFGLLPQEPVHTDFQALLDILHHLCRARRGHRDSKAKAAIVHKPLDRFAVQIEGSALVAQVVGADVPVF